jgi:uncharacterized protein (DUF58 family)
MRLTARGWAVLAAAVVLLAAGLLLGLPLLRALAGFGAGALLVSLVPVLRRVQPTVHREVHPRRLQRGEQAVARLVVANDTGRRQPAFVARDTVGGEVREVAVRALPRGASTWQVYELPTGRRGRVVVGPLVVERGDLLGLARSRGEIDEEPAELWVYPRRHAVRLAPAGRPRHHHEGAPPPWPVAGSMDLRALREYTPGDDLRHLHWKATARTGQLMVREYTDPAQPWCVVLLDDRSTALPPAAFEEAVEVAASILWEAAEQERPARLATASGLRVDTTGGAAGARVVLDRLCELPQVPADGIDVERLAPRRGDGWFVHVGGAVPAQVAVAAARFGEAVLFDLSPDPDVAPHGVPTVRAADAAAAVRAWNARVSP